MRKKCEWKFQMKHYEVNFDGLVGPTHNYAGLSFGNVASVNNASSISNPKQAALQGLAKMKALYDMGLQQGILAPQERPDIHTLRRLGFSGNDKTVIEQAFTQSPNLFLACCSASSMWTANAATVSPSADTSDGKIHFTPANLSNKFHRSIETNTTGKLLKAVFSDQDTFAHHPALPNSPAFGDEGAANHTRLCSNYGETGLEVFVYGQHAFDSTKPAPQKFPARQTLETGQAIARMHGLDDSKIVHIQQNPAVIDKGVFHNDVIAVGNRNVLFYHQEAFFDTVDSLTQIKDKFGDAPLHFIEVKSNEISVDEAIKSYLFNTQIISLSDSEMAIIAPTECRDNPNVHAYLNALTQQETPIKQVYYFDVKDSMKNGGGPACLRLRVAMKASELKAVNQQTLMNESKYHALTAWVNKHYRDQLNVHDLCDPQLLIESRTALDELTQLLDLGSVYTFQQA
jgi:succinylarginine dihydrolase